jgi:hypothetical protein
MNLFLKIPLWRGGCKVWRYLQMITVGVMDVHDNQKEKRCDQSMLCYKSEALDKSI